MTNYDPDMDLERAGSPSNDSTEGDDKSDSGRTTFLVPKDAFEGKELEIGSIEKVKVVHIFSEEVEMECVGDYSEDEEPPEVDPPEMEALEADA